MSKRILGPVSCWSLLLLQAMSVLGGVGCATSTAHSSAWKRGADIAWPGRKDLTNVTNLGAMDGGAALAASAALREVIKSLAPEGESDLFSKCPSPAEALDVRVSKWRGLYYVDVDERFDRCDGARNRLPGWSESYAVSPAGEVLARRGDSH